MGQQLVIKLIDRFRMIIVAAAMLLSWIACTMAVTDPAALPFMPTPPGTEAGGLPEVAATVRYGAGIAGALLVLALGELIKRRRASTALNWA